MSKYLLAGLGNPGATYQATRHNIGYDMLEAFAYKHGGLFKTSRLAEKAEIKWKGRILICIKPTTFMNLSGLAVKYWMDKEKIALENLLVLVDEIALPLNKVRLRPGGSAAGHNGLINIEEVLKTDKYPRLRFGVGNDFPPGRQVDHVLGRWREDEWPLVRLKLEKSVEIIECFLQMGIEKAMNQYNKLDITL